MHFEFYQSLYESEWARKDEIQGSASVSIGVLAAVTAALGFAINSFPRTLPLAIWFWLAFVVAAVAGMVCAYNLVRVQVGHTYRRLADPSKLLQSERDLVGWYKQLPATTATPFPSATEDFELQLCERLVEATDHNTANNVTRGEHLHRANVALVVALIATALAVAPVGLETLRLRLDEPVTRPKGGGVT